MKSDEGAPQNHCVIFAAPQVPRAEFIRQWSPLAAD